MTPRRACEITAAGIVLACLALLTACGDQPPPRQSAEPPPAAKEVQTLREQELAAEKRAAEATAAGDQQAAAKLKVPMRTFRYRQRSKADYAPAISHGHLVRYSKKAISAASK